MSRRAIPLLRLEPLLSSPNGLTESEVQARREEYGPNAILDTPPHPWWDLVRDTAKDPMLWFFAGTSGLYAAVGQHGEALTLLVAILPLLGLDAYLHRRTQASTEGLKSRLAARATVLREGKAVTIPVIDVVPGDLALVSTGDRRESGDPMDGAIVHAWDAAAVEGQHAVVTTFPFTEDRKRETAVVRDQNGQILVATKGAAEVVLGLSTVSEAERTAWERETNRLAEGGHKVIAVASCRLDPTTSAASEPESGYQFAGLLAFEDPVREGVAEAVAACKRAGIHAIMVTGDHPLTAGAMAREVGLGGTSPRLILGDDLEHWVKSGRGGELRHIDVTARARPAQKLLLVQTLQQAGEIVAVTGDGVNDVPALQAADIGVAMGERGTRSAREAASIVLLDDNFRTIVRAIGEGRQLFRTLRLSFQYLLMIHIPLIFTAALIPLAGYPLLYLPVHIIWLEMIIHPTAMLVFQELPATEVLEKSPPRGPARFFSRGEWAVIVLAGTLLAVLVTAGYLRSLEGARNIEHGRAMALATLTLGSAGVTAALSRMRSRSSWLICLGVVAVSVFLIQTPIVERLLHLQPLHRDDWALASLAALFVSGLTLLPDVLARWRGLSRVKVQQ